MSDNDWCPTQSGTGSAWEPQWRVKGGEWQRVPTKRTSRGGGVPGPLFHGGVIEQLGLFGYEQAMALAWSFAAVAAAVGDDVEVRAAQYDLRFDLKARKVSEPSPDNAPLK